MRLRLFVTSLLILSSLTAQAWGFWAHQRINRLAAFTLPPEMLMLYKRHLEYLTEHAVDPDKRRYAIDGEAEKHYIDFEHYGSWPFDSVPQRWDEAVDKYSEEFLHEYGMVPYHLPVDFYRLKQAFEDRDLTRIIKVSADLGHYIGDAHVPLHTTENYNGQLTGQKGIHGFWESRLPELYGEEYDFFVGRAFFIDDVRAEGWAVVRESHALVDSVLRLERELARSFPDDRKYGYESRNNVVMRVYSRDYSAAYHDIMNGMVERRMRQAVRRIGAYWYTAWKLAGSPDLSELAARPLDLPPIQYERKLKIIDRESQEVGLAPQAEPYEHYCCLRPASRAKPMGLRQRQDPQVIELKRQRAADLAAIAAAKPWYERWWQEVWGDGQV